MRVRMLSVFFLRPCQEGPHCIFEPGHRFALHNADASFSKRSAELCRNALRLCSITYLRALSIAFAFEFQFEIVSFAPLVKSHFFPPLLRDWTLTFPLVFSLTRRSYRSR